MNIIGIFSSKWKEFLLFLFTITVLFFVYDYHEILGKRPQSIHQWRQCDGSSIALMYANNHLNFFAPACHNQMSENGRVVAEFPIVYYLNGILISIFGNSDLVIRLVNLLIFYLGLFFLFRISMSLTNNSLISLLPVVVLHSFPVVAYYATTSLPNIPALSLMIMGIYFLSRYYQNKSQVSFWTALLLCGMAGMIKSTTLLPYLAILIAVVFKFGLKINWRTTSKLSIPVLMTLGWIFIAKYYNSIYGGQRFYLMEINPIWQMDGEFVAQTYKTLTSVWISDYTFLPIMWSLLSAGLIFLIIPIKENRPIKIGLIALISGTVIYFYFFFEQFYHHDYYAIELYWILIAFSLALIKMMSNPKISALIRNPIFAICLVLVVLNVHYTQQKMQERYPTDAQLTELNDDFFDLEPLLRAAGIQREDKVVVAADNSPNISLYLMNQLGWTRYPDGLDGVKVGSYHAEGAEYLICRKSDLTERPYILPYLKELLIEHKTLQVYRL